jgi:hypothetical protein
MLIDKSKFRCERKKLMIKSNRNRYRGYFSKIKIVFGAVVIGSIMLFLTAGCSSGPSQTPEKFVRNFLAKHVPMIDFAVANFYVKEEQTGIKDLVTRNIETFQEKGDLDSLKTAQYDFSNVNVKVIAQKADYVDDEEKKFVKVEAKGTYTLKIGDKSQSFTEDEIIILALEGEGWKVTEKTNPWK